MKSILLATIAMVLYASVLTLLFRIIVVRERAALMTVMFLLSVPFFIWGHLGTPPDLWFLPVQLTETSRALDLLFGLVVYFAGFFGGILQLYNLSDRGLSLRMLIDIRESGETGMSSTKLMKQYGAGKGINWMYEKRVSDMLLRGLVFQRDEALHLTDRGKKIAQVFTTLRSFLRLDR